MLIVWFLVDFGLGFSGVWCVLCFVCVARLLFVGLLWFVICYYLGVYYKGCAF